MKRTLFILLTPAILILGFWAAADLIILPRVAEWAREKIESVSHQSGSAAHVTVKSLELRLFSPTATMTDIQIEPQNELAQSMGPTHIDQIRAHLNLFEVALGQVQLGSVTINNLQGSLEIDPLMKSSGPAEPLPLDQIFTWTKRVPIHHIVLENAQIKVSSKKQKINADVTLDKVLLTNLTSELRLHVAAPSVKLDFGQVVELGVVLTADLTPKELNLRQLRIRRGDLQIRVQGRSTDPANLPVHPRLQMHADTDLTLDKVGQEIALIWPKMKLPPLSGNLQAETDIRLQGSADFESSVKVTTSAVHVGQFEIGDAKLDGRLTEEDFAVQHIEIHHSSGTAEMTESQISFAPPYKFHTTMGLKKLDLQALFQALNLKNVPVDITLAGNLPCEGEFDPFNVRCIGGKLTSDRLVVSTDVAKNKAKTIVALNDLAVDGDVSVDSQKVGYHANLRVGKAVGTSEGIIDFEDGFVIKYKTPSIAFTDVDNLADLKFQGSVGIDGDTRGNGDTAKADMILHAKDFVFENYTLGDVASELHFAHGHLKFDDMHLSLNRTRALGKLDLNLHDSQIGGEFDAPSLDAADLAEMYSKIWKFPLDLQASGKGHFTVEGPLDFWKMDYNWVADFGTGRVQGDSFDKLHVKIRGDKGYMHFDQAELRKGGTVLRASGGIRPDQTIDTQVELNNLRLEESEMVNRIHSNVAGQLNITTKITGNTHDADVHMKGSLSDIVVDEQEVPGSFFDMRFTKAHMEGEATLFGNRIQSDILIPYQPGTPLRLRIKTTDWAFTSLLSLIGASSLQSEYDSSLTSDIDLRSDSGRFDRLTGRAAVRELRIQRGGAALRNPSPMDLVFNDGQITLKNVFLEGPNHAFIRLQGDGFRSDKLALGVQADTDLRLLHLLVPFLEDIGGRLKVEASLSGSILKPEILGNASLQNAFVKLKGFPHAVDRLQSEIIFSQTRVLVQNLKGQMAGGTIEGEGSIQLIGFGNIPVNLRLRGQGLTLNVPDKVRSTGSADLVFSGDWFPFTLSGTYACTSALVEKEFGEDNNLSAGLRTSTYLPKILREAQFDPVVIDIKIPLEKNIVIKNSMMDGSVTGQIEVKGPPQSAIILGKITTEPGSKVIFKDKPFEIQTGNITLSNPDEINPEIYLSAQSRVEDYDINVIIQGLAKTPAIRMTSTPPLSEQDIISLLALGVGPISQQTISTNNTNTSNNQANSLGYEALGMGITKSGTGKAIQKTTGFDVRISSSYDQIRNVSTPKVSFTRKLTERVNAVYSRPIGGDDNSQEIDLQYQVNSNVSAVASFLNRDQQGGVIRDTPNDKASVLGLDLEFKREFK